MVGGAVRGLYVVVQLADKVSAPLARLNRSLDQTKMRMGKLGSAIQKHSAGLMALGGVLSSIGALTGVMASRTISLERVMQEMQARTGASDEELQQLGRTLQNLARVNSNSFQEIGETITVLRQRWGALGSTLEPVTQQMLDFAKVTGMDAVQAANAISVAMKAFNMDVSQAADVTDLLLAAHQRTGLEVDRITESLKNNSAALSQLGLSIDRAIGLLAALEDSGANVSRALMGLRQAAAKGIDIEEALNELAQIEDRTLRLKRATEIFGSYAGPGISRILEGGMESLNKYMLSVEDVRGITKKASKDIDESLSEQLGILRNNIALVVAELGKGLIPVLKPVSKFVMAIARAFSKLPKPIKTVLSFMAALTAIIAGIGGPLLLFIGALGMTLPGVAAFTASLGAAAGAVMGFAGTLGTLAMVLLTNPITLAILGIVGAILLLRKAWQSNWGGIQEKTQKVVQTIRALIDRLASGIRWLISQLVEMYNKIKPVLDILSYVAPGVGQLKLVGELVGATSLPPPNELATSTVVNRNSTTIDQRKIEIQSGAVVINGVSDPDKAADLVIKKLQRQFMAY